MLSVLWIVNDEGLSYGMPSLTMLFLDICRRSKIGVPERQDANCSNGVINVKVQGADGRGWDEAAHTRRGGLRITLLPHAWNRWDAQRKRIRIQRPACKTGVHCSTETHTTSEGPYVSECKPNQRREQRHPRRPLWPGVLSLMPTFGIAFSGLPRRAIEGSYGLPRQNLTAALRLG